MKYEFLPPYSPDYNPIEHTFSAIKSHIRQLGETFRDAMVGRDDRDVYILLCRAVYSVTPEDARNWVLHCGYTI